MGGWSKAGPDAITRAYRMDEANSAEHHNSRPYSFRGGRPPNCSGEWGRARIGSLACLLTEWARAGRDGHEGTDHSQPHRRTDQASERLLRSRPKYGLRPRLVRRSGGWGKR